MALRSRLGHPKHVGCFGWVMLALMGVCYEDGSLGAEGISRGVWQLGQWEEHA